MTTRDKQKELRKTQIMMTSLDLFVRKGYSATKISDIAKVNNMSVGTLFHYFESKEKLYEELVCLGLQGTHKTNEIHYNDPIEYFESLISYLLDNIDEQEWIIKMFLLMSTAQRSEGTPDHIKKIALEVNSIQQSVAIIEAGQKIGSIRKGNSLALSIAFWSSVQGVMEQLAFNPKQPKPEKEWLIDIIKNRVG